MMLNKLQALVNNDFIAVNNLIMQNNQSQMQLVADLAEHIVQGGGKRLRPLLVLLSSHALGYTGEHHITLAAMIELFHTATLLHDDVIDNSTLRRGRETAHEIWGSKSSILVGDYLFTQSVQLMVSVNNWQITKLLADIAHQISCGEIQQLTNKYNAALSIDEYLKIIHSKTALLFAASAGIGALLNNASIEIYTHMYEYGLHLGNAYQLIDDMLDYCADANDIGKNIGDDLADGKVTMPILYLLKYGDDLQKSIITESIQTGNLNKLLDIISLMHNNGAIEYTRNCAQQEINKALLALDIIPESIYKQALYDLTIFIMNNHETHHDKVVCKGEYKCLKNY